MLILKCQKCGEVKIVAGTPEYREPSIITWQCQKCGAGHILRLKAGKNMKRCELTSLLHGIRFTAEKKKNVPFAYKISMELK